MTRERLSLDCLETFLALIESGSFSAAGERRGLAQSTVSQHLRRMEDVLGASLILRGQRGCQPTETAQRLTPHFRGMLRLEERIVNGVDAPSISLGASSNIGVYILPALMRQFRDQIGDMPDVRIASNPELFDLLDRTDIDVALLEWWDHRPGFRCQPWRTETMVVIVNPAHSLADARSLSRQEFASLSLIGGEPGTGTGRLLATYFEGETSPTPVMSLGSTEAVKRAVEAGLGASIVLSSTVQEEARQGRLRAIPLQGGPLQKILYLLWRNDVSENAPLVTFLARQAAAEHRAGTAS